ncbi:MAG: hypothetical protein JKY61_03160 [Planctomycetes bacterium]|nr:hypothetical protein [Planctomycetota bacterium]
MQTNIAHSPTMAQSRGLPKKLRLWTLLGLQAIIFVAVTRPLFRSILVNAGESDAKSAVHLIAKELAALPEHPPENLAAWMSEQPILLHKLSDARIVDAHLEYHGYRISWEANSTKEFRGTLWAIPLDSGKTGRTNFHIQVR